MNSPNFDNTNEFEWDGKGELEWTENHWKKFLRESDGELARFISYYQSFASEEARLDRTAQAMGWDAGEWADDATESDDSERQGDWINQQFEDDEDDEDFEDFDDNDPYTIHKHPLFVSTRALYFLLSYHWQMLIVQNPEFAGSVQAHLFGETLRAGETNAIMAIHSLEMGDYNLCVCHLQWALTALNETLAVFQEVTDPQKDDISPDFIREFNTLFFDLREVWLRVIRECRGTSDQR
jgi:hypothetical protein